MSTAPEPTKGPTESGAESPTTARPFEMDDDDVQESGVLGEDGAGATTTTANTSAQTPASTEAAPPKPPRPLSEAQKNVLTLKEAFPSVEDGVIKAVLSASGGRVEPAFNALLEMTDPDAAKNEAPPPQPPRRQAQQPSQLEADERYARQLAQHYDNAGAYEARTANRGAATGWDDDDREHSFLDDDLPIIRENLRKGFQDTQKQVNSWITNFRKKMEDGFDESDDGPSQGHAHAQGRPGGRSSDYERYDADPHVLSDDFAGMKFSESGHPVRTSSNPSAFRQQSNSPRPSDGRRVNFRDEHDEINMYDSSPKVPPKDLPPKPGAAKASKWQPLSEVDPNPIGDNDPFSLGDSEDEKDTKDAKDGKDGKDAQEKPKGESESKTDQSDDNERLKQAAAEAMADSLVDSNKEDSSAKKS